MRLPRDRILHAHAIDAARAGAVDAARSGIIPGDDPNREQEQYLEQVFLLRLLLADKDGHVTLEQVDEEVPRLVELGTVVTRPYERDPTKVRVSFRPASPIVGAIRPARRGGRPAR